LDALAIAERFFFFGLFDDVGGGETCEAGCCCCGLAFSFWLDLELA
jgi:hypothetical protein